MSAVSAFIHMIEGRLRIKLADVKGAPDEARAVETQIRELPGVNHVTANPVTGSVLILYDTERTGIDEITEALQTLGYLSQPAPAADAPRARTFGLGSLVLRATTEAALQQLFVALI